MHCRAGILFLFTYAKIEYVSVRTYLSKNRIRTLRILEPCFQLRCRNGDKDVPAEADPATVVYSGMVRQRQVGLENGGAVTEATSLQYRWVPCKPVAPMSSSSPIITAWVPGRDVDDPPVDLFDSVLSSLSGSEAIE